MLNQLVLVFLFGAIMIWGLVVAEHQQARHDKVNQEVNGYVID
jgi:hypothetical protein